MPKTRAQKADITTGLSDRLGRMAGVVLADFTGVKVKELDELRAAGRAEHCEYVVVKKTLFRRAVESRQLAFDVGTITGPLSILFGFQDPVSPAKVLKRFAKAHPAMRILGGIIREDTGVRTLDQSQVNQLGDLPSRDELRARMVGSLAAPLRGMVGVMAGNLRKLVYVLEARRAQLGSMQ